ncbi:ABC transporter ATP-binding protein [Cohnella thermotolerans]|uniref:ABC transporter ATP-binding protein n=1 Tax=Cohnella thermotolerans TaxID=329858 RepID=UPI0004135825|nr:ABC transporter ATP-binding protein [Cohnella thermotolerans]
MTAIETNELRLTAGVFRLSGVSITVPVGQITAIVGPNGSGKSTLLKLIAGLLAPGGGSIVIHGKPLAGYKRAELARELSMLPQSGETLPELTVRELAAYGRSPYHGPFSRRLNAEDEQAIDWALERMNLRRHEDRMARTLSGGERQRALIAMALAQKTGILLLDEPTTYLDIAHQLDLMRVLSGLNREYGLTIVMVLHDLQQAAAFCGHLIAVKEGAVVARGAPQAVITPHFLKAVYDIDAKVRFDEAYPLIIPLLRPEL